MEFRLVQEACQYNKKNAQKSLNGTKKKREHIFREKKASSYLLRT